MWTDFIAWITGLFNRTKLQPVATRGGTQAWYGRVNRWMLKRSILVKELNLMAKSGISGYMIEMSGWGRYNNQQWTDKWLKEVEKEYKWLLKQCRARGLWLFTSIVNDNMGQGKYGDSGPKLEKVYSKAQKLIDIVKKAGKKNVFVQPVAETQTAAGRKFEQECVARLSGFQLVFNGSGGHPKGAASGFQWFAVHPGKISQSNDQRAFVISDHGLIIRELANGKLDGPGNPAKVDEFAKRCKRNGNPVCGYYAFKHEKLDKATIQTLGKAMKAKDADLEELGPDEIMETLVDDDVFAES